MSIVDDIEQYLYSTSDDTKRARHKRIANTRLRVVGGTVPTIRKIAKWVIKSDLAGEILKMTNNSSEEILLLRGFIIAFDGVDETTTIARIDSYLDDVDNWECIDSIASAIKYDDSMYRDYLTSCLNDDNIWRIRYGVVGLMDNYLKDDVRHVLSKIVSVHTRSYYIDMAIAWAISVAYVYDKEVTLDVLLSHKVDDKILRYAIGKVRDSYRVSDEDTMIFREQVLGIMRDNERK